MSSMEIEMMEMERLLGKRLTNFILSSDFVELEFENNTTLIIEIIEDGDVSVLNVRVV